MPLDINKIKKLMGDKSQGEIAAAAGMAQPNLARILSGKFDPKLSTVERLALALGCKVKDLIGANAAIRGCDSIRNFIDL